MAHDHHHSDERRVFWAMALTGGFMLVEVFGGIFAGSLALIADAGHMLTDTLALGLAWFGFRLAKRPSDDEKSYGYHRFQILAAFVNGLALFAIAAWILFEAVNRLREPIDVLAGPMMVVAIVGLLVNIVAFFFLHGGDQENLNMRGAVLHVLSDILGSVAAIVAAALIMATGWTPIDPILSILVVLLILRAAYDVVRRSGHILLEGTPNHLSPDQVAEGLLADVPGLVGLHHMHLWSLTNQRPLLTLHGEISPDVSHVEVLQSVKSVLSAKYNIDHSTIQLEVGDCPDEEAEAGDKASHSHEH
jgi:cobalt-zinc-cadmium efflux system protein